jgi:hypothetical protein
LLEPLDEEMVQGQQIFGLGPAGLLDAEVIEHDPEEVQRLERRVEDERRRRGRVELRQKRVEQRRLARTDLAGEQDEALARTHSIHECRQALAMGIPEIEEGRIRRHLEGGANQAVELAIHPEPP